MQRLIERAKQKDDEAKKQIIESFMPLIYRASSQVYITGYETEDLVQEGRKSVLKAIELYKIEKGGSFPAYVKMAVEKNFRYLIRGKVRENYQKSLNEPLEEGGEIGDSIPLDYSLEEEVIKKHMQTKLRAALKKLTKEEMEMVYYFFCKDHGGITEYSKHKGISYKEAYKSKTSLINKLREYII